MAWTLIHKRSGEAVTAGTVLVLPLVIMTWATIVNSNIQTEAALYAAVIVGAIAAGVAAGIRIASTDTSTVIIVFVETALGSLWLVLSSANLNYFSQMPTIATNIGAVSIWTPIYSILSIMWVVAMILAPRGL